MRTPTHLVLVAASLLSALPAGPARAEDAPAAAARPEVRAYAVGALVRGQPWFFADRGPFPAAPDQVNDEEAPLYGGESEEGVRPLGGLDELQEALKQATGGPGAWEAEGTSTWAEDGPDVLYVEAPPALQAEVAAQLAAWARDACATLVADVAVLEGDAEAARGDGGLAAAICAGALVPLALARVLPSVHGTGTARDGGRTAFLADYDTEVACECNVPDPIIGVAPHGLAARAVAMPTSRGRWILHVQGWWAGTPSFETRRIQGGRTFGTTHRGPVVPVPPEGDAFEVVRARGAGFRSPLVVKEGAWETAPLSGRLVLAARLRVERPALPAGLEGDRYVAPAATPPEGERANRAFDVQDLVAWVKGQRGVAPLVPPSNYTPPEPPEVPAWPGVSEQALLRLIERAAAPQAAEDGSLAVQGGRLVARADGARSEAVARVLAQLRATRLRSTRVEATVVAMPLASIPEAWGDPDAVLSGGVPALLARPGARVVDRASLDLRDGQRLAAVAGARRAYVADYDVEIACTTTIGNPVVSEGLFLGTSLDVRASPVLSSPLVSLVVRFDRSALREMRALPTRFGEIEAPSTVDQSLRGAITLGPGETRLFGLSAAGPEATLVLLSLPARP